MAGRRPLPTEVRRAEGESPTRGRGHSTPIEADDFQPEHVMPEMPKAMPRAAKREWYSITRILFDRNVLTVVDGKAIAAYCVAYALAEQALKDITEHGEQVAIPMRDKETGLPIIDPETKKPYVQRFERNPAVGSYQVFSNLMHKYLIEFGLTPASRSRLKLPVKPKEDEFDKVMGKREIGFDIPTTIKPNVTPGPVNTA